MPHQRPLRQQLEAEIKRRSVAQFNSHPTVKPDSWSLGNDIGASLRSATGSKAWPNDPADDNDEEVSEGLSEWGVILEILEDIVRNHTNVHGELKSEHLRLVEDCEDDPSLESLLIVAKALDNC